MQIKQPVILVGETGTSKTAIITNFLRNLDPTHHVKLEKKKFCNSIYILLIHQPLLEQPLAT